MNRAPRFLACSLYYTVLCMSLLSVSADLGFLLVNVKQCCAADCENMLTLYTITDGSVGFDDDTVDMYDCTLA